MKQKEASEQEDPRSRASRSLQRFDCASAYPYITFALKNPVALSRNAYPQALVRHARFRPLSSLTS